MKYNRTILNVLCFGMFLSLLGLYLFGDEGPWDAFVYFFGGITIVCLLIIDFCVQVVWEMCKEQPYIKNKK